MFAAKRKWKIIIFGVMGIALCWTMALGAMYLAGTQKMTAEKVTTFVEQTDFNAMSQAQRDRFVDDLSRKVNALPFEERRVLRTDRKMRETFEQMTPQQRGRYIEQTLPSGLKQTFDALNAMTREERQALVDRALRDMAQAEQRMQDEPADQRLSDEQLQRIVNEGMRQFFSEASADTKHDLQPLIEQFQAILRKQTGR